MGRKRDRVCRSVQRVRFAVRFAVHLQFFYFVFEVEFFSLQFEQFQIARGGMVQFRLYLLFEHLMATHEFCEMAVQRHPSTPFYG